MPALLKSKMPRNAETRDRTGDLQIFSLTLSQLSYRGFGRHRVALNGIKNQAFP